MALLRLLSTIALAAATTAACQPTQLGQCHLDEATTLVYDNGGSPAYAGQALVQENCSVCHSERAVRSEVRRGAPRGLDFEMVGARSPDPAMPDAMGMEGIALLRSARQVLFDHRFDMFEEVEDGTMPPGAVGRASYAPAGYQFGSTPPGYPFDAGDPLPSIESAEGREIFRGWLSCGAPVVAVASYDDTMAPGTSCTGPPDLHPEDADEEQMRRFACVVGQACDDSNTTWTGVFEGIIEPLCASCHSGGTVDFTGSSALDLCGAPDGGPGVCDAQVAYDALVGIDAAGDECGGQGMLIAPSNSDASVLVHKVEGTVAGGGAVCGDVMPIGTPLSSCEVSIIRAWIDAGAMND